MSQSLLSEGLDRIDTQDLLPFQEASADIVAINHFVDEMNHYTQQHALQHQNSHQSLHLDLHQHSYYTPNVHHLQATPCLEDLDSEFKFEVEVPMDEKEKKLWYYDAVAKRLFVKGDQGLSAFISCRTSQANHLYVRLMPVYTSLADVRKPVTRCPNHKEQCKSEHRAHIVNCHNEGAKYMGKESGETFVERMSVLVPLRMSLQPGDAIREEIIFSFTCLNSCSGINRRPTALIFTLENEAMEILGRTVMNFRACTSPKRDFESDRKKRGVPPSVGETAGPSAKRPMLVRTEDGTTIPVVKLEHQESSQDTAEPSSPASGECLLTLTLPDKETALKILHYTQDCLSGEITRGRPVNKKYFKQISKQIDEVTKDMK